MAKSHHTTFPINNNRANAPFSIIHSDVWGPAPLPTHNGMQWFVTFVITVQESLDYTFLNAKVMCVMFFKFFTK